MMRLRHYTFSGLRITSELLIPEWGVFEQRYSFDDPDVLISLSGLQVHDVSNSAKMRLTAGEYLFHVPEAGTYLVRNGREIVVKPTPDAGEREVRLFLLGSAWGALCYQRGILALHASAVQVGDHCVAFCGPAGSGKSTIAASLVKRGYPLISDDLCRFEISRQGPPIVYPSAPRLKLWRDTINIFGWNSREMERDHFRTDKFHLSDAEEAIRWPVPLRSVFLVEWGEPGLAKLKGLTALYRFIVSATYRGDLLEPMRQVAAHWQRCAALLERVPVMTFSRSRNWQAMEAATDMLIARWQDGC